MRLYPFANIAFIDQIWDASVVCFFITLSCVLGWRSSRLQLLRELCLCPHPPDMICTMDEIEHDHLVRECLPPPWSVPKVLSTVAR